MHSAPWHNWAVAILFVCVTACGAACATSTATEDDEGSSRCGDGLIDQSNNEECDDGNNLDGDGCSAGCALEGTSGAGGAAAAGSGGASQGAGGTSQVSSNASQNSSAQASSSASQGTGGNMGAESVCDDMVDNDKDNATDCADTDCDGKSCGANGLLCQNFACVCPGGSTETQCANMADDDCDGDVDCADADCVNDSACMSKICPNPIALNCSSMVMGTTVNGPTNISSVGCNAVGEPGPEAYYTLQLATPKMVTVTLNGSGAIDLDLAIVGANGNDCDPQNKCISWGWGGTNDEQEVFSAQANTTYYVIVESPVANLGNSFALSVSCN